MGDDLKPGRTAEDHHALLRPVVAIATIAWAVATFLPILDHRYPPVPEITPVFMTFLGAVLAVPEVGRFRGRSRKDDDE